MAASIGAELADVGVNLDFAPVADVNTNPDNPVIGIRAFGADGDLVARHVAASVRGLQSAGVAACAKHFPGHGDTSEDSHLALPVVDSLDEVALEPFRAAIDAGVLSMMTAHIVVRSVGDTPATMSRELLHDLLRDELGFTGMVMTDALEMKAISATVGVEEGAVRSIAAGADALCLGHDLFDEAVVSVRDALVEAVSSSRLPEERLGRGRFEGRRSCGLDGRAAEQRGSTATRVGGPHASHSGARARCHSMRPPLVVELQPEPGVAAGRLSQTPGEWFASVVPDADVRVLDEHTARTEVAIDGRQLVVIARDAHRHPWQREADRAPDCRRARCRGRGGRPPALAPTGRRNVRRDLRRRPRERGSGGRAAILRAATRGGAVR